MRIEVLDKGFVRLIESWGLGDSKEPEAGIIEAARQSTQGNFRGWNKWFCSECGLTLDYKPQSNEKHFIPQQCNGKFTSDNGLLQYMFNNKHSTPFEFCGMVIEVKAPIFVFREWHRHRTQGYNEMSARYAPLPDDNYIPSLDRLFLTQKKNKQAQALDGKELTKEKAAQWFGGLDALYAYAEQLYQEGLDSGVPKELARIILPVGRYSQMRATANLRNWLGFLTLRDHPDAQWEIQQYAKAVGQIIEECFPLTYKLHKGETI